VPAIFPHLLRFFWPRVYVYSSVFSALHLRQACQPIFSARPPAGSEMRAAIHFRLMTERMPTDLQGFSHMHKKTLQFKTFLGMPDSMLL